MKKILLTILPLLLIVGCSKDLDTLQNRGGIKYEINSEKPFSGSVYKEYQSGEKELKGNFKNGKKDGLWTKWLENGQKEEEETFKDGEKDGKWTNWYENGQKELEVTYKDGKEDGLYTRWFENGQKSWEGTYKDGKKISSKGWNEDGTEQ